MPLIRGIVTSRAITLLMGETMALTLIKESR